MCVLSDFFLDRLDDASAAEERNEKRSAEKSDGERGHRREENCQHKTKLFAARLVNPASDSALSLKWGTHTGEFESFALSRPPGLCTVGHVRNRCRACRRTGGR